MEFEGKRIYVLDPYTGGYIPDLKLALDRNGWAEAKHITLAYLKQLAKGDKGEPGNPGSPMYLYIGYASDSIGSNFSTIPTQELKYISFLVTTTSVPEPYAELFTNWIKYIGDDGSSSYRFVKHFDELPDPNHEDVEVGDLWNDPVTLEEYRLIEIQEGFRAWVETTSPKILSDGSGTAASPKALKLSMI